MMTAWKHRRYHGFSGYEYYPTILLTGLAAIASCLMHSADNKRGLVPLWLGEYSSQFLWFDRIAAASLFSFACLVYLPLASWQLIYDTSVRFSLSAFCMWLGEQQSDDPLLYALFHTFWHYGAFRCLNDVIS